MLIENDLPSILAAKMAPSNASKLVSSILVEVSDTQSHLPVDPDAFAGLARRTLEAEGIKKASISIALVNNASIHAINRRHLDHDWPTDVITFTLSEAGDPELSAELVISAEMAKNTAKEEGKDAIEELNLYLVHGLLHLCGEDDVSPEQSARMRRREAEILDRERRRGDLSWTA